MSNEQPLSEPVEVFYSYSHRDERFRKELENHLSILQTKGIITGWHDRRIVAGTEWKAEIDRHIDSARIILLLVSSDFLASKYAYGVEAKRALERHEAGEAQVIPVILRTVDWEGTPFSKLQALPTDGRPVDTWGSRDVAFKNVSDGIKAAIYYSRNRYTPVSPTRRPLLFGSVAQLRHKATGRRLHSHEATYGHEGSSGQQQVTACERPDENGYWLIRGPHGESLDYKQGEPVRRGDVIRLEHIRTRRNLHSHDVPAPVSASQHEVSCFGDWGVGNSGDNWRLEEIAGGEDIWHWDSAVKLVHEETGWVLHSHDNQYWENHHEVTCFSERDDNDWWELSF
ncbi:MAG: TIR domain-containing protein [Chloroflexota bacterium]|nr:TIR domain-containing protein [Chloroflexota bacterium]MDQ5865000.1 TIR domain-containing protein [Chloroflexota bacterium]